MFRFGSVRLALSAVSFDDVSVGTVRFGASHLPGGGGWGVWAGARQPQKPEITGHPRTFQASCYAFGEVGGGRWEVGGGGRG